MQARRSVQGGERPEPCQRGTKRLPPPPTEAESDYSGDGGGRSCTDGLDEIWPEGTQGLEQASLQGKLKMQELGGVQGRDSAGASRQPQEHAIVVAIGCFIIWGVVNAIPLRTLEGLMAQMALASTKLGETCHGAWFARCFPAWHLGCTKG